MLEVEQLHFEDALEDSPHSRHLLLVFEKDAMMIKKYSQNMQNCCQRIMSAQNELCSATQSLAQLLRSYEHQDFPLEYGDSVLAITLRQFATFLDDISSVHQVLAQQFSETMIYPLNKFLQADMEEITTMHEMYKIASNEHEQSISKYMKQTIKKDDKDRVEINREIHANRKRFHQTALHYYSSLNALQFKKKCFLLEPIMGFLHAQRTCFQMGQDMMVKSDIEQFLGNIGSSVQEVHTELAKETQKTVEIIETIEKQSQHKYFAEPPPDMPFIPPNTNLSNITGYLFCRTKQVLLTAKWERLYFFTQGKFLMSQPKEEVIKNPEFAGSLVIDLSDEGIVVESCQIDDRRHTFQIVSSKKTVILQAENYRERDEWIATLNNIIREREFTKLAPAPSKKKDSSGQSTENISAASNTQTGRVNPFDQASSIVLNPAFDNAAFSETFTTRFLGSMEVKGDRGEQLVHSTIRQIMAARAIHNVFKMTESLMVVSSEGMRLIDPSNNIVRVEFALQDISFWSAHPDNNRLFGFITRNRTLAAPGSTDGKPSEADKNQNASPSFSCHVFESNTTAEDICQAISTATKVAFQALMEKRKGLAPTPAAVAVVPKPKAQINEKNLLLKNIQSLPCDTDNKKNKYGIDEVDTSSLDNCDDDISSRLPLSPDGKFLILTAIDEPPSPPLVSPVSSKAVEDSNKADEEEGESEA
ncbi:DCC-interacting protein 13-alpha-like isoform X3 [Biomphalaria glabrata]|uniref:DCC-interacting protein 13-alpha-like isoform X3 n=1 Tax=Biomphalaria glabrata TaxID=6526 RepID=A0A9W3A1Y8_BIOGL|nr:DCC-interacting protein 13-alpha-like isoform X3 [Biomphalaria glabrata]